MSKTLHKFFGTLLLASAATAAQAQKDVPYAISFDSITSAVKLVDSEWTILDASEKTGKTWGTGSCYTDNGSYNDICTAKDYSSAYNDFLISPALKLQAGKKYSVKTLTALLSSLDMELSLQIGTSNNDASTFTKVADLTPSDKGYNADDVKTSELTVEADGNYYLAILAKSEATTSSRAHAFSFSIEEVGGSDTPDTPDVPVETKELPYTADLTAANAEWTTISGAEAEGSTWAYDAEYGFYDKATGKFMADVKLKSGNATPDYYVSPAVKLEGGKQYIVRTLTAFNNTKGALDLSLQLGSSATDSTSFSALKTLTPFVDNYDESKSEFQIFEADSTGIYYLAFKGKTVDSENSSIAHLFNLSVEEFDGSFSAPYAIDFSTIQSTTDFVDSQWSVIDASEIKGVTWKPGECYTGETYVKDINTPKDYKSTYNDYLVSPGLKLQAGKTYSVKTLVPVLGTLNMKLTLELGTSNVEPTFTSVADITPAEYGYNADAVKTSEVKVDSDGVYYLAIHATNEDVNLAGRAHALSFSIEEKAGSDTPDTPETPAEETVALPYTADLTAADITGWSTIGDATTGGTTWAYEADYGFYDKATGKFMADVKLKSGNATPDYYVSPAFQLEADKEYAVKTLTAFNNTKGALELTLALGTSRTDSTTYDSIAILKPLVDNYDDFFAEVKTFKVETSGAYHLAFKGKTVDAEKSSIAHLFSFAIAENDGSLTTGIKTATSKTVNADAIYNLNGQRIVKAHKGIFIVAGKKVVLK